MGMAVMLDEIINYVQSLQHQVEVRDQKSKRREEDSVHFFVSKNTFNIFLLILIAIHVWLFAVPFFEAYCSKYIL